MTRDDIIKLAKEAKLPYEYDTGRVVHLKELERFAELVAAAEREACAKLYTTPQPQEFVCSTGLCRFTLTQTNVGIGERGMQAYEEAKKRGWVGISDEGEKPAG